MVLRYRSIYCFCTMVYSCTVLSIQYTPTSAEVDVQLLHDPNHGSLQYFNRKLTYHNIDTNLNILPRLAFPDSTTSNG